MAATQISSTAGQGSLSWISLNEGRPVRPGPRSMIGTGRVHGTNRHHMLQAESVPAAVTSVRVSRATLSELRRFRKALGTRTADETIRALMLFRQRELISRVYGSARLSRPFTEADRLDTDH